MKTCDCSLVLVDYLKGEMDADAARKIEEHIQGCATCRQEMENIEQTLNAIREELVPIELSAHFRLALARRLDETLTSRMRADRPEGEAGRLAETRWLGRLSRYAQHSPYFVLSLFAHAALLIVAAALFVMVSKDQTPTLPSPAPLPNAQPENTVAFAEAYRLRAQAPRVEVAVALTAKGSALVDLSGLMLPGDESLLLESDQFLHCLRGYRATKEGLEEMRRRHQNAIVCPIADSRLELPPDLANAYIGAEKRLWAISLDMPEENYIELWTLSSWRNLEMRFSRAEMTSERLLLAVAGSISSAEITCDQ